jgi:hypothetical protein
MRMFAQMKGSSFRDKDSRDVYNHLEDGTSMLLERDRENKYDENAVKVLTENEKVWVAYLAKEDAVVVARYLEAGFTYTCHVVKRPQLEIVFDDGEDVEYDEEGEDEDALGE